MSNLVSVGDEVKDQVTGFKGIVTTRSEYLYGCVRCLVVQQKLASDGKQLEGYYDEAQLIVLTKGKLKPTKEAAQKIEEKKSTGGPSRNDSAINIKSEKR